jgi:hypothetical protein
LSEANFLPSSSPYPHMLASRGSSPPASRADYLRVVGQINYIAFTSRPDVSFSASALAAFSADPSVDHLSAAKRTMRYLSSTPDLGVTYYSSPNLSFPFFHGFADSDWGGDTVTRRSTSGGILAFNGCPFDWVSSKQPVVSLSSNEAELVRMFKYLTSHHHIWWIHLLVSWLE